MPSYKIRGVDVEFPFDAYDCQLVYMESVIRSLQEGCNALLESPTGTGKTLCLLCASLAWRQSLSYSSIHPALVGKNGGNTINKPSTESSERKLPTIIYTSRTHSQLRQVIQELKTSPYRPRMVVLGSREQMCIHDKVKNLHGRVQNNICYSLSKKRRCYHYNCVSDYIKNNPNIGAEPVDIEDLVNIGRTNGPCPYYLSRELHKAVDIVFAPYNYLIDPGNRSSLTGIQWENTILIFDEAHNLESICADAASFDLTSGHLAACISEAKECVELSLSRRSIEKFDDKHLDPENFAILKALLLKLEKQVKELPIQSKELGFTQPGSYIFDFLGNLNITYETSNMLIDTIEHVAVLLEDAANLAANVMEQKKDGICRLESLRDFLKLIFRDGDKGHGAYYRFHVHESEINGNGSLKGENTRTLSWWCFNPGIAMEEFVRLGIHSIILTSGTLCPMESFALELNLPFPVRLENPHVISPSQVWVGVIPAGPSGSIFNSSYRNRDSSEYQQELGNAVVNFARIVPGGLLVFFPSYYVMDNCIKSWQSMSHGSTMNSLTIWERISRHKQPVIEPRQSALFPNAIEDYKAKLNNNSASGAVFFAVCRGKVSEGLDFADNAGRAVIITGIPYAMRSDAKVRLKREYLDSQASSQKRNAKVLTGDAWYDQQAARAVNQAIGRVIRHRHDYGAIIFCDERFSQYNRQRQLPLWLQPHVKCYSKFGDAAFTLTRFFRDIGTLNQVSVRLNAKPKAGIDITVSLKEKIDEGPAVVGGDKDIQVASELSKLTPGTCCIDAKMEQHSNMILSSKAIVPLVEKPSRTMVHGSNKQPLSSLLAAKRVTGSQLSAQIMPANKSILTVRKLNGHLTRPLTLDISCAHETVEKFGQKNYEAVDLSNEDSVGEQVTPDKVTVSHFSKKAKSGDPTITSAKVKASESHVETYVGTRSWRSEKMSMPEKESGHCCREESSQHASTSTEMTVDLENVSRTNTSHKSTTHGDEKATKASDFLKQVRNTLSSSEYKEFVEFLKALRSKSMKASSVLESVAMLFSAPERLFLLKRFKDYVPAPYIPLYEQHLKVRFAAIGKEDEWNR
ncbi:regulator of telomere elongation helicase 1 homolog isoform X2 [Nymphaea colorata]|uniref:regulator of telomere elongation helicase 1 homolog isoform X2 n=1 Tax=Nymphaea colorata TaxID=210225 RepID=UPI00129ECD08|nr:regulator of telomere elongation helicase 1 homolog isoform X2 [Nymphaea colorata]